MVFECGFVGLGYFVMLLGGLNCPHWRPFEGVQVLLLNKLGFVSLYRDFVV